MIARPLLAVPRREVDQAPKHVGEVIPAAWLAHRLELVAEGDASLHGSGAPLTARSPGDVDLMLTSAGAETYLVQGHVHATVSTICGRCAGPADVPIDAELTLLLVPAADHAHRSAKGRATKHSEGEFEFDPDEADVAPYNGEALVLDDIVCEALLLELPISPLCSENCPGMADSTGFAAPHASGWLDPRLAPLADLRAQLHAGPVGNGDPRGLDSEPSATQTPNEKKKKE